MRGLVGVRESRREAPDDSFKNGINNEVRLDRQRGQVHLRPTAFFDPPA